MCICWSVLEPDHESSPCRFVPKYFESDYEAGQPTLTEAGWLALEEELKEDIVYPLEDSSTPSTP